MSNSKQEFKHLLANNYRDWFKLSQAKKEKKPYRIVKIVRGHEQPIEGLEGVTVNAVSASQARYFFFERYPWLLDYIETFGEHFEVEARLDEDKYRKQQAEQARLQRVKDTQAKDREEMIQNAWWQD